MTKSSVLARSIILSLVLLIVIQVQCLAARRPFLLGGDLSMLTVDEGAGVSYTNDGTPEDCIKIFRQAGWKLIRVRLWVNPSGQNGEVMDLPYVGALLHRAKLAGMKVLLDLHYSDSWTDAGNQKKPAAWSADTFDTPQKLYNDVFWYTSNVIYTLAHHYHVDPDYVQIGNEVTYGMLWPDGYLGAAAGKWTNWTHFATLVNKAVAGARRGSAKAGVPMPKIVIHISDGLYWGVVDGFFSGLTTAKDIYGQPVEFNIIGLSYYPDDKTDISDIKGVLANCANIFHKPILICETAYQYQGTDGTNTGPYPQTPDGQAAYLTALVDAVKATPDGLGLGVCYWEPEAVPNAVTSAYAPGSWRDSGWSALFNADTHAAEPGIASAGEAARSPLPSQ